MTDVGKRVVVLMEREDLPSSRVSGFQFREHYERAGLHVEFAVREPKELRDRREGFARRARRLRLPGLIPWYERRASRKADEEILRQCASADFVLSIKISSLELLERIRALRGPRNLLVFNDAFWLPFAREHGWRDLEKIFTVVDGVVCPNEFTADYVRGFNPRVFIIPDAPQVEDFDALRGNRTREKDEVVIGWIGSPLTATALFRIWEPLEQLASLRHNWRLRVVGAGYPHLINVPRFEKVPWTRVPGYDQTAMIEEVLGMDIGLFPLFPGDDSRARGYMKAAIYMSGGAAVLAERYADNESLIIDGVNGLLASSPAEWLEKLLVLVDDPDLRRTLAERGLETVRTELSRDVVFEKIRRALESM